MAVLGFRRWLPLAIFIVLTSGGFAPSVLAEEASLWIDRSGRTMEAALVGYDRQTKEVIFEKGDRRTYRFPLVELSYASKLEAVWRLTDGTPPDSGIDAEMKGRFLKRSALVLLPFAAVCLLAGALIEFLFYWLGARMATGVGEWRRHALAWIKLSVAGLFLVLLPLVALFVVLGLRIDPSGFFEESPWRGMVFIIVLGLYFLVVPLLATVAILRSHYEISWPRAWWVLLVVAAIRLLANLVFWAVGSDKWFVPGGRGAA